MSSLEGKFLHANPIMAQMTGYASAEKLIAVPAQTLYCDPSDRERFIKELLKKGSVKNVEGLSVRKDGTLCWISLSAVLQKDDSGKPVRLLGLARDITQRKMAEEALKESEERFRTIFERARDGIVSVHRER